MLYLSRNPHLNSQDQTNSSSTPTLTCINSIFSASDSGIFEDISIIQVSENSIIDTPWEWFAHQSSAIQFQAVVIPRNPSFNVQIVSVVPSNGKFLCAIVVPSPRPFANLCMYSPHDNLWNTTFKINYDVRNPMVAATAILDNCLYLAGGYMGNPSCVEPLAYLNSGERLNLESGEWEKLPPMQKARSSAKGFTFGGKFYVVGGTDDEPGSAEMYSPVSKEWKFVKHFMPTEYDGFAINSFNQMFFVLLTWSDRLGVKLWSWKGLSKGSTKGEWTLIAYHPNQDERHKLKQYGARLVKVGNELWIVTGESSCSFHVNERSIWPTFPGPAFVPGEGRSVKQKGHIYAFSWGVRITNWRKISVYSS